jgi:hypothetical protein
MKTANELKAQALLEAALNWSRFAQALRERYSQEHGDNGFPNRYPISGGICEHWPRICKDNVVKALRAREDLIDRSLEAWRASGRRRSTWLRLKDSILGDVSVSA